ncbi:uncharacterized protein LOC134780093 [Penaeus indicus]|uniref:uncharacterized protein LOC134780093 n=1 Tax=Penaeus indicus TaxID=29960 RepID=UPI00300D81C8
MLTHRGGVCLRPGFVSAKIVVFMIAMSTEAAETSSVPERPASVTLDGCSFFHIWNHAIRQQRTTVQANESPVRTLLSPDRFVMINLVPQDAPHPLYSEQFTELCKHFLLDHMLDVSIDSNDPRMTAPGGLPASTLAANDVVFRKDSQGKITVNDNPVKEVQTLSDGTVIYTLDNILFNYQQRIQEAFEKLLEEEASNYPLEAPPF